MTDEKTYTDQEWLCCGFDWHPVDHKLFVNLTRLDGKGEANFVANKRTKNLLPGIVYSIPVSDDGQTFKIGVAKHLRMLDEPERRQAIVAASRANEMTAEAHRMTEKRTKEDRGMGSILDDLRREYAKLRTEKQRIAFELLVIQAIRNPR